MAAACTALASQTLTQAGAMMTDMNPLFALVLGAAFVGVIVPMVISWFRG